MKKNRKNNKQLKSVKESKAEQLLEKMALVKKS